MIARNETVSSELIFKELFKPNSSFSIYGFPSVGSLCNVIK